MHDLIRDRVLFVQFARGTDARTPDLADSIHFVPHNPSTESLRQSLRVTLSVRTLERVLAPSEFTVVNRPADFHCWPFAFAIISRA
jgi:hypothetical protein